MVMMVVMAVKKRETGRVPGWVGTTLLGVGGLLPGPAGREGARGHSEMEGARGHSEMEGARATGPSYEGGGDMSRTGINSNRAYEASQNYSERSSL